MKKTETIKKIIEAGIDVFSTLPYEEVAMAQICQRAGISNGSIYNYFSSKEILFKYLLDETCLRLDESFKKTEGETIEERLESFITINLYMAKKEYKIIKIYREGQYKFPEYEQKLRKVYINALIFIFKHKIDEIQYLYIMSGIRFINVRYAKGAISPSIKTMVNFILKGCFKNKEVDFKKMKDCSLYTIVPFNPNNKKSILLQCGEKLFGENGYHNVKITDITESSGIAIKTFYKHFSKKEEFLEEISGHLTHSILFFLQYNTNNVTNLFEKHIFYMFLIISFFENSPYRYQLIRESEFVLKGASKEYFYNLENLYLDSFLDSDLNMTVDEKKLLSNFLIGISHYIGIELFFTKNIKEKFKVLEGLSQYLLNGVS